MSKLSDILSLPRFYTIKIDPKKSWSNQIKAGDELTISNEDIPNFGLCDFDASRWVTLTKVIEVNLKEIPVTHNKSLYTFTYERVTTPHWSKDRWVLRHTEGAKFAENIIATGEFLYIVKEFKDE